MSFDSTGISLILMHYLHPDVILPNVDVSWPTSLKHSSFGEPAVGEVAVPIVQPLAEFKIQQAKESHDVFECFLPIIVDDANIHAQNQTLQPHINGSDASIQHMAEHCTRSGAQSGECS